MCVRSVFVCLGALLSCSAELLQPAGGEWDFLLYKGGDGLPADPQTEDADFHTTWMNSQGVGYDGPDFEEGNAYFSYGGIGSVAVETNPWDPNDMLPADEKAPPSGSRNTVYFRTIVMPAAEVSTLEFTGIIDDGVIIYVNGVERTRFNMEAGVADIWELSALSQTNESETHRLYAHFSPPLSAGELVTIGVSVHNFSSTNNDLGFGFQVESVTPEAALNDAFADAQGISFSGGIVGMTDDGAGGAGATKETGEPDHAGNAGGASVWYTWRPSKTERVSLSTLSSEFDTMVAVYTGSSVDALTPVSRFRNLDFAASSRESDEPFSPFARVEFEAIQDVTYYIAVDGEGGAFGRFTLRFEPFANPLNPVAVLLPAGSLWEHLLARDESNQPIDPASVDVDFHTSWFDSMTYDGPMFEGPDPAPLGYGGVEAAPIATNVWAVAGGEPPSGLRNSVYFRTTFTPDERVTRLGFEGIVADGAIFYVNGVEVARMNVDESKAADDWLTLADGIRFGPRLIAEKLPQQVIASAVDLPAGQVAEIGVSLHNDSASSNRLGIDLRIYALRDPVVPANFRAVVSETENANEYGIGWPVIPGESYRIEFSTDLIHWCSLTADLVEGDVSGWNEFIHQADTPTGFYRISAQ